ncbi:hypothetical protein IMY05_004G0115500 [Salix suchowensis]|nr:hypothetical protein IMY05_004G0115500 [Salix suchowensis]
MVVDIAARPELPCSRMRKTASLKAVRERKLLEREKNGCGVFFKELEIELLNQTQSPTAKQRTLEVLQQQQQELELEATAATTRTSQAPTTTTTSSPTAELSSKERTPKAKAFSTKRQLEKERKVEAFLLMACMCTYYEYTHRAGRSSCLSDFLFPQTPTSATDFQFPGRYVIELA